MSTPNPAQAEDLKQESVRAYALEKRGKEPWTSVYRSWHTEKGNGAEFVALAPPSYRSCALRGTSWDISIGDGAPAFCQWYEDGKPHTEYQRYPGRREGVEPLVVVQNHHGVKPRMLPQLTEEFRLFHNLWLDPNGNQAVKVCDDGTEEIVAELAHDTVRVRTKYLRQFQAARQVDLLLFIDSVVRFPDLDEHADYDALRENVAGEEFCYSFYAGTVPSGGVFSRFLAKRILPPPPVEKSGVWPFEREEEEYPDFIIAEDDVGDPVRYTCNPAELGDYFGANPDAPHYLTPVFFRRDVLQRYYEEPEKYAVDDGYLHCGGLWGMRLDNDHPQHVMVFLGDLGEYLPEAERSYWRTFNIPPTGHMSETVFRRSFLAQPTDPAAPDLQFKSAYLKFCSRWKETHGWDFFKPLHEADRHVLARLRVPLNESQPEFEDQLLSLTKLLVDSLNERELTKGLGGSEPGEKGISKLERWLEAHGYPDTKGATEYFRRLQRLRSYVSAHRKSSKYEDLLEKEDVDESPSQEIAKQLVIARDVLASVAAHFGIAV